MLQNLLRQKLSLRLNLKNALQSIKIRSNPNVLQLLRPHQSLKQITLAQIIILVHLLLANQRMQSVVVKTVRIARIMRRCLLVRDHIRVLKEQVMQPLVLEIIRLAVSRACILLPLEIFLALTQCLVQALKMAAVAVQARVELVTQMVRAVNVAEIVLAALALTKELGVLSGQVSVAVAHLMALALQIAGRLQNRALMQIKLQLSRLQQQVLQTVVHLAAAVAVGQALAPE